jgi:hypothetical protein
MHQMSVADITDCDFPAVRLEFHWKFFFVRTTMTLYIYFVKLYKTVTRFTMNGKYKDKIANLCLC